MTRLSLSNKFRQNSPESANWPARLPSAYPQTTQIGRGLRHARHAASSDTSLRVSGRFFTEWPAAFGHTDTVSPTDRDASLSLEHHSI